MRHRATMRKSHHVNKRQKLTAVCADHQVLLELCKMHGLWVYGFNAHLLDAPGGSLQANVRRTLTRGPASFVASTSQSRIEARS
jgi:hypothetical protein